MPDFVDLWVVCIAGWREEGKPSGIENIQDAIHRKCHCDTTRVLLKSWRDNMPDLASRMWHRSKYRFSRSPADQPRIVIIGYSYGGWTACILANELKKRKWKVENLLLIDPVWRPISWLPSPSSLWGNWTIDVPNNVNAVNEWHQKINKPSGHKVITSSRTLHYEQTLMLKHGQIDDDPQIFNKALAVSCPEINA